MEDVAQTNSGSLLNIEYKYVFLCVYEERNKNTPTKLCY